VSLLDPCCIFYFLRIKFGILKVLKIYCVFENNFVTALRQESVFNCFIYILASGLCKQLLGYLVGRDTLMIKRMCCLLWWQMQEIASVVQFQVIIAHQLLLANFAVNIWYANLHSEHIFTCFGRVVMLLHVLELINKFNPHLGMTGCVS
jgi:hypothetical protein